MRDAPDPGFAALDATIAKALARLDWDKPHDDVVISHHEYARAVREALVANGEIQWRDDSGDWPGVLVIPLGVGVAPDQHNTPHA